MTADNYSLCITHVLIFINKELVPHVHAKLIGLFTTPPPQHFKSLYWSSVLKKKKKKRCLFHLHETENIGFLPVCEASPYPILSKEDISLLSVFNLLLLR